MPAVGGATGGEQHSAGHEGTAGPNNRVQATGNSLRSFVAPAIFSA